MNMDYKVGEVELSYKSTAKGLYKITDSEDVYKHILWLPLQKLAGEIAGF